MGVVAVRPSGHSPFQIVNALNAEWTQLNRTSRQVVAGWAARHAALEGCASLHDVLRAAAADSDPVLAALLLEHRLGDDIAGRAVLQQLLGRIVTMSLRDPATPVDDYIAALWVRIRTYPLAARPTRIAANLALDTLKLVKTDDRRASKLVRIDAVAPGEALEEAHSEAQARVIEDHNADLAELTAADVITAADRLGLIDGKTRAVLLSVYAEGLSGRDAAERHQTSPDMIRHRCSHALRRLAQHAAQLAEAA